MKNKIKISNILFLPLFIIIFFSCNKNDESIEGSIPQINQGYEVGEAGMIMTLAAISYVAEGQQPGVIKDSIIHFLKNTSLATGGVWELAWGPGISGIMDNLAYIAVDSTSSPISYAIVIRGTNINSIDDIIQDLQAFTLVPFKYGLMGDSVAHGSMRGLDSLLNTHDSVTGKTIEEFLHSLPADGNKKIFITGHSQGGALAPLMTYWFIKSSGLINRFVVETYAFAGPSVSNKTFKENFTNSIPATGSFHMVSNSLDIVPYFWARSDSLVIKNIPTHVPLLYKDLIKAANIYLQSHHIKYSQLADQISIGNFPPKDTIGSIHPSDSIQWYDYWALTEHRHNNYLRLLNVEAVN